MSTQPTHAHIEMAREICGRESDSEEQEYAAQLIADSEAKVVEHAIATIIAKNAPEITKINTELATMKARAERAEDECLEQARLLGMSASREASLLGEISQLEQQLAATRAPT